MTTSDEMLGTAIAQVGSKPLTRRDALKKGAIAGGTVLWVAPAVQGIGMSSAFAAHPSPTIGHGVSFVAFRFTCGTTTYFAKIDFNGGQTCTGQVSDPDKNSCGVNDEGAVSPFSSGCTSELFDVTTVPNSDGEVGQVIVTLTSACDGQFIDQATKCGTKFGGCHSAHLSNGNRTATFDCP